MRFHENKILGTEALRKWKSSIPIYAVGEATASGAKALGYVDVRGGREGTSKVLSELIIRDYNKGKLHSRSRGSREKEIVFLSGDKSLNTIYSELSKAGVRIRQFRAYTTSLKDSFCEGLHHRIQRSYSSDGATVVFVALFSPSAVDAALPALREARSFTNAAEPCAKKSNAPVIVISAGPTTTKRLLELGVSPSIEIERGKLFPKNFAEQLRSYLSKSQCRIDGGT